MLKKLILSFTSLVIIGLVPFALSNQRNTPVINVAGNTPLNELTQVTVGIDYTSVVWGAIQPTTKGSRAFVSYPPGAPFDDLNQRFVFESSLSRLNQGDGVTSGTGTFFTIPPTSSTDATIISTKKVGENENNAYRLISINLKGSNRSIGGGLVTFNLNKTTLTTEEFTENVDNDPDFEPYTVTTVNYGSNILMGSTTTNSISTNSFNGAPSDATLSNNGIFDITKNFDFYNDEIYTFRIVPSKEIYISQINLTYAVDYTNC